MKYVVVSGGFDPIHSGHIKYLKEAKKLGDKLIVILNTKDFLEKKKGYFFMPFSERKEILKSIKYIDSVIKCIDKDLTVRKTIWELHKKGKIDIFAKGGDKTLENIPERGICKRCGIKMVFGVGGGKSQSSTYLINRIYEIKKNKDKTIKRSGV